MAIDLNREEIGLLHEVLHRRAVELNTEINRTDSLAFKDDLRALSKRIDALLDKIGSAPRLPLGT